MAKVKKMAFGGMGGYGMRPNVRTPPARPAAPSMKPMGALGGNQAPAGANLMQAYNNRVTQPDSNLAKTFEAFNQQRNMGASTAMPTGSQAAAPAFKQADDLAYLNNPQGMPSGARPPLPPAMPTGGAPTATAGAPMMDQNFTQSAARQATMKKGGTVKSKSYAKGGTVSSASKRGDGIAQRGKTKGRMV